MFKDSRMLQKLMQQAQKTQKELEKKLAAFDQQIFEHTFGADHVKIKLTGNLKITNLTISDQLWDDPEMTNEILIDALNEAIEKVTTAKKELQNSLIPQKLGL